MRRMLIHPWAPICASLLVAFSLWADGDVAQIEFDKYFGPQKAIASDPQKAIASEKAIARLDYRLLREGVRGRLCVVVGAMRGKGIALEEVAAITLVENKVAQVKSSAIRVQPDRMYLVARVEPHGVAVNELSVRVVGGVLDGATVTIRQIPLESRNAFDIISGPSVAIYELPESCNGKMCGPLRYVPVGIQMH